MSVRTRWGFLAFPSMRKGNKMFATYYYDPAMSVAEFDYQLVSFEESLKRVAENLGK